MLEDEDISAGDFVRNVKQLIDLLRRIGDVAPVPGDRGPRPPAAEALHRGVVAASSALEVDGRTETRSGDDPQG